MGASGGADDAGRRVVDADANLFLMFETGFDYIIIINYMFGRLSSCGFKRVDMFGRVGSFGFGRIGSLDFERMGSLVFGKRIWVVMKRAGCASCTDKSNLVEEVAVAPCSSARSFPSKSVVMSFNLSTWRLVHAARALAFLSSHFASSCCPTHAEVNRSSFFHVPVYPPFLFRMPPSKLLGISFAGSRSL